MIFFDRNYMLKCLFLLIAMNFLSSCIIEDRNKVSFKQAEKKLHDLLDESGHEKIESVFKSKNNNFLKGIAVEHDKVVYNKSKGLWEYRVKWPSYGYAILSVNEFGNNHKIVVIDYNKKWKEKILGETGLGETGRLGESDGETGRTE